MDKKKILIISRSFYPVNSHSICTTEFVNEFKKKGHEVTLLTTAKDDEYYIPYNEKFGVTVKDLGTGQFQEIQLN